MKIKITNKFNKETTTFMVLTVILVFFTFFAYLPQRETVKNLKSALEKKKERRNKIKSILSSDKGGGIVKIEERFKEAKNKFPRDSNLILKYLSEQAHILNLDLASLAPEREKILKIGSGKIKIEGKKIYILPITLEFRSNFEKFTNYLKKLTLKSPYLIRIRDMKLKRVVDNYGIIHGKLQVLSYYKTK